MSLYAVIVAAGNGTRMRSDLPKQFMPLLGKPVLLHTTDAFVEAFPAIKLIVVTHPSHLDHTSRLLSKYDAHIVAGAETRSGSVKAGLQYVNDESAVFIHDAARCLVTPALIRRCYEETQLYGNAVPAVMPVDSFRAITPHGSELLDRSLLRMIQTPQTFRAGALKEAYLLAGDRSFGDDAAVAELSGIQIHLTEGEATNIKLTHPSDFILAGSILQQRNITAKS